MGWLLAALPTIAISLVVISALAIAFCILLKLRYKKAGPEEALIIYGRRALGRRALGRRKVRATDGGLEE